MREEAVQFYREEGESYKEEIRGVEIEFREFRPDGDPEKTFVATAGGPGMPKEHVAPLAMLSQAGYRVVLYDQHNTGNSAEAESPYVLDTFRDELGEIVSRFSDVVFVGHSWGAMLGLEYAVRNDDLEGLVAISPLFDAQKNLEIARTLAAESLTTGELEEMIQLESKGRYDDERYEELEDIIDEKRGFQPPIPEFVETQYDRFNVDMYEEMWGPVEYRIKDGAELEDWSVMGSLESIDCPVMLLTGRKDLFGIHDLFEAATKLEDAEVEILEQASHTPLWESVEESLESIKEWLQDR